AQGRDVAVPAEAAHQIAGVAADQAVGLGDHAGHTGVPVAPRHRPAPSVPEGTGDHVAAVAQGGDGVVVVGEAHIIPGRTAGEIPGSTADQAVGVGNDAADPGRAAAPGHRPATSVPETAIDHVVAVAQDGDALVAHEITRVAAHEAVRCGDR